jgi:hypothetical protein
MQELKIVVEKTAHGYVVYPLGLRGIVIGQGRTYNEALSSARSDMDFHVMMFGGDVRNS